MDSKKASIESLQSQLTNEAIRDILKTALVGGGIAGTIRGGQGLWNLLTRSREKLRSRPGVAPLPVPYHPSFKEEEEEKEAKYTGLGAMVGGVGGAGLAALLKAHAGLWQHDGRHLPWELGDIPSVVTAAMNPPSELLGGAGIGAGIGGAIGKYMDIKDEEEEKEAKYTGLGAMVGGVGGAGLTALLSMIANKENFRKEWYTNPPEGQKQHLMKGKVNTSQLGLNALGQGITSPLVGGAGIGAGIGGAIGRYFDIKQEEEEEEKKGYWRHGVHYSHKTKNLAGKKNKKQEKQATNYTSKTSLPWYMPAMLSAGLVGGVGTWKVIDHILDQRRRKELEDEVTTSRDEFQNALVSQYKQGSDSELGVALDELYLKMQKAAKLTDYLDPRNYLSDNQKGMFTGMYGTYAIPSALLSFLAIKKMTDKGSRRKIMEKAQRQRALKQQRARPAELYAVPSPIEEEEEEEE